MTAERGTRKLHFSSKPLLITIGLVVVVFPVTFCLLNATQSRAESQTQSTRAIAHVYEVASIKPNKYSSHMLGIGFWLGRFTATGVTLQELIREAYEVENNQISGAPPWLDSERYDIEAKADKAVADELDKLSFDQRVIEYRRMLQTLLADRLKLTLHRENKVLPVYALVIAKNGHKLKEVKPDDADPTGMTFGRSLLKGQGVSIAFLVRMLSQQQLGRPVLDKTGLTGKYDFTLQWTPDENRAPTFKGTGDGGQELDKPPDSSGPSIFTSIQEQLGLKLESQKGPVEVLVIDHVEKPSEN